VFPQTDIRTAPKSSKRKSGGTRRKRYSQRSMCIFFNLEWSRPSLFHRVAEPVEQAESGISGPGENEFPGATRANHLIENDVGTQPNQGEIAPPLPDDFMSGRKWHQVAEPFQSDTVAIMDESLDCFLERRSVGHDHQRSEANQLPLGYNN
jgi:hypothetical protein